MSLKSRVLELRPSLAKPHGAELVDLHISDVFEVELLSMGMTESELERYLSQH